MRTNTLLLAAVLLLALGGPTIAGDWTSLGGNSRHDGQAAETGPGSGDDLLWEGTASAIFGGPIYLAGDRLVTMRFQSTSVAPIVCHDLDTGALLWSVEFAGVNSRSVPRGVHGGRVIATNFQETQQDTIVALDLQAGARLWTSPVRAPLGIVWTACFAPDGDPVLPSAGDDLARLDAATGLPVWQAPRDVPNTGAEAICVHDDRVYGIEGFITTPKTLTAWDLATGARLYTSPALDGDGDQEMPPTVAPDGTIYLARDGGPLYALDDDGTQISVRWQRPVDAYFYSGHLAVGPDGSVYCPDGTSLVRLDPDTGAELARSPRLIGSPPLKPRVAIDPSGTLYVGNSGSSDGRLYVLTPDLDVLWEAPVGGMVYGGPALGDGGALAVAGSGTLLQVFRSQPTAAGDALTAAGLQLRGAPNPCHGATTACFALPAAGPVSLAVYDVAGRAVRQLLAGTHRPAGVQTVAWDGRDAAGTPVASGTYLLRLQTGRAAEVAKVRLIR